MIALIAAILILGCAACKEPTQKLTQATPAPPAEKWQIWDDAELRFEYPNGWLVRDSKHPEGLPDTRLISVPGAGLGTRGLINMINGTSRESERRPLDEIARDNLASTKGTLHRPLGAVTKVSVKDGDCIVFTVEEWVNGCAPVDTMTKKRVTCIAPTMNAFCLAANGSYFQIHSSLSRYHENGKPNDEARANARIFERFLRSLEFKKG